MTGLSGEHLPLYKWLDRKVFVEGLSFFYTGVLTKYGFDTCLQKPFLLLTDASIVYQTGNHQTDSWLDTGKLPNEIAIHNWNSVTLWKQK